jgi:hypothetical protein
MRYRDRSQSAFQSGTPQVQVTPRREHASLACKEDQLMFARLIKIFSTVLVSFALSAPPLALAGDDGIVKVKSAYPLAVTIERLKSDIAGKGIKFFDEIDQSKLAADAGIKLRPSVLLVFGNPPLMAYTDFSWIARRHGIESRDDQFNMATKVIASITSSAQAK